MKNNIFKNIASKVLLLMAALFTFNVSAQINTPSQTPALTVFSNNLVTGGYFPLLTQAVKIAQVQVLAGATNAGYIFIYDNNVTNATYTNGSYVTRAEFQTNQVYTFISPLTGTTNLQTNAYWAEVTVTNPAATNNLPGRAFPVAAGTMATYPVNMIMAKGVSFFSSSSNLTLVVTYRIND